jgi:HD-like signal output (HDOD) protein
VQKVTELPPMPEMAQKIFALNANPYARVQDLAAIVELDPSLSAQVVRYARSPFFGYRGRINSVHEAIARVLGYDLVMNIALGIAAAAPFRITREGPLGLSAFWRHATYSAVLAQSLSAACTTGVRPRQGLAYLAALLHNFGYLLLGHLYPQEFTRLNDAAAAQPSVAINVLERDIVGTSHAEIGAWLMEAWNMPGEIIATVREHHNAGYDGANAGYVHLVRLVDHVLRKHGLGDADSDGVPPELLQQLGLSPVQIDAKFNKLIESRDELDDIARTLAA